MRTITNACGTFWVEDDGTLQYFECAPDNYGKYKPEYADVDDYDPERHLIRLDIPEGITVLSTDFDFNNYTIEEVTFPKSLRAIEELAFYTCVIGNLVMPECVEEYHCSSFVGNRVQQLLILDSTSKDQVDKFMDAVKLGCGFPIITPFERVSHLPPQQLPLRELTNISGSFWVDAGGVLRKFECAQQNYFPPLQAPNCQNEKSLHRLEIPEGVTALPAGAFDGYTVYSDTKLPESLTALGDASGGVFRHSKFGYTITLPKGITFVGEDSFYLSAFGTVRISDDMDTQMVRRLVQLFRNHTYHSFLFFPVVKIRDLPPLEVPTIPLHNESGTFYVDKLGVLQDFCCSPENNADNCSYQDTKKLYTLHIPEGVTVLKEEAFRDYTILYKMTLPSSLRLMGTGHGCVLADCKLPNVVMPKTLRILGDYAFGHSSLRSLRLPENAAWEYARQFKEGEIGTLYVSQKYRDVSNPSKLSYDNSTGHLHSLCVNNVRIGEIVWLE
ncbi:MAG: leucine-rich repeat protein [Faecousia sp.]